MKRILQVLLIFLIFSNNARTQTNVQKWNLNFNVGKNDYIGSLSQSDKIFNTFFAITSIQYSRYIDSKFDLVTEKWHLKNKIAAQQAEIKSLEKQKELIRLLVRDYETMLQSEDRLFSFGESSIFLINARENNLVAAQLAQITIENRVLESNAALYKIMGNP